MLSEEELRARIAAEFLRVGASQQSWDQNFPEMPSTWVPGVTGSPVLSDESREAYESIARPYLTPVAATPPPARECPEPSVLTFIGSPGSDLWACVLPDGSLVVTPDEEEDEIGSIPIMYPEPQPVVRAPTAGGGSALPVFVGGRLGRVIFPYIANRQLNGVRVGTLPQVVFGDIAPASYAGIFGFEALGGAGSENVEP